MQFFKFEQHSKKWKNYIFLIWGGLDKIQSRWKIKKCHKILNCWLKANNSVINSLQSDARAEASDVVFWLALQFVQAAFPTVAWN